MLDLKTQIQEELEAQASTEADLRRQVTALTQHAGELEVRLDAKDRAVQDHSTEIDTHSGERRQLMRALTQARQSWNTSRLEVERLNALMQASQALKDSKARRPFRATSSVGGNRPR